MTTPQAAHSKPLLALASVIVLVSLVRIVATYSSTAQAFDEPCHVSAAIEFLDKGTYTLDPVHPPLARVAIGLPLYLAGERYPNLSPNDPASQNYNVVGNHILYDSGHFARNLELARLGVLPFFVFGAWVVYMWARHAGGNLAALIAVCLYCTTPSILAFSSIAYTDIVAASTQLAAMFVFALWLQNPARISTLWLAVALGAAFLAKFTSLLFIPAAAACMTVLWFWKREKAEAFALPSRLRKLVAALALVLLIVWGGYRFSVKHLHEVTGFTASSMPSFQHFPGPLRTPARSLVLKDPLLPAPELLRGLADAWVLNRLGTDSYLLGRMKFGGWWYFFLVALGVKTPLPLILLFGIGLGALIAQNDRIALMPVGALLGVLLITMHVSYQVGTRHVLVVLPLIAIIAGIGVSTLVQRPLLKLRQPERRSAWRLAVIGILGVLMLWQVVESLRSQPDFLAYFNQLAGKDPSTVLVTGCDLDCGEDLYRLAAELHSRHVSSFTLAIWSSADVDRYGLPPYQIPDPAKPLSGWIAVSARAFRVGDVLHQSVPTSYFAPLQSQRPVAAVGKTIHLYYIPDNLSDR